MTCVLARLRAHYPEHQHKEKEKEEKRGRQATRPHPPPFHNTTRQHSTLKHTPHQTQRQQHDSNAAHTTALPHPHQTQDRRGTGTIRREQTM
nr:MAG TPA: hypothetical protein [Caudoviricetes sp.]